MKFQVYVIHSAKPLSELKGILTKCGGYTYAGIIYKSFQRSQRHTDRYVTEKEETKKTIVFCPESTIKELESKYTAYKGMVANYNWSSFPLPNENNGETWNLHISGMPKDYTVSEAETLITDTLKCIMPTHQVCEDNTVLTNYSVEFTPRLRETGEIYGFGQIVFGKHVDRELVKLCKVVLHNTPVSYKYNSKEKRMVTCMWHKTVAKVITHEAIGKYVKSIKRREVVAEIEEGETLQRAKPVCKQA